MGRNNDDSGGRTADPDEVDECESDWVTA